MNEIAIPNLNSVEQLCLAFGVAELHAFGSVVEGGFDPESSDYDFLVRFLPCSPSAHADHYFGLLESLQDLLDSKIDLVEIDAVTNKRFERSIERHRVLIYDKTILR